MTSPAKIKGDQAERDCAALIADLTGFPARRKLGAGRADDVGDIDGVPDTVVQVVNRKDMARGIREKIPEVEQQRQNAAAAFGVAFVRKAGGGFVVVMSPETWASYAVEAAR